MKRYGMIDTIIPYKRMYEAISKSTCTITFKDVESQDIITYKQ